MRGHPFAMEAKVDGERMLCHKDGDKVGEPAARERDPACLPRGEATAEREGPFKDYHHGGGDCSCCPSMQVMWLTRSATDYSERYGPVLTPAVLEAVGGSSGVTACILDGEVVAWDPELQVRQQPGRHCNSHGGGSVPMTPQVRPCVYSGRRPSSSLVGSCCVLVCGSVSDRVRAHHQIYLPFKENRSVAAEEGAAAAASSSSSGCSKGAGRCLIYSVFDIGREGGIEAQDRWGGQQQEAGRRS